MNDTSVSQSQMSLVVAAELKDKKAEDEGKQVSHVITHTSKIAATTTTSVHHIY